MKQNQNKQKMALFVKCFVLVAYFWGFVAGDSCVHMSMCCETEGAELFRCICPDDMTCIDLGDVEGRFIINPAVTLLKAVDCHRIHVLEGSQLCGR